MPSFFKDFRRLSRSNFKAEKHKDSQSSGSSGDPSSNQSSVDSGLENNTPPSTIPSEKAPSVPSISANGTNSLPARPPPSLNRYSIANRSTSTLATPSTRPQIPISPYAPRVLSVSDNSWVHQRVLLIYGQIAEPAQQALDGTLCVSHHQDSFPPTSWPVSDSHFKAVVVLQAGPNRLKLDFTCPKVPGLGSSSAHTSYISINYLPMTSSPPLDLVILLGNDSPGTFDAVPERQQREGNRLDTAIRKYRMAAYLWQAFTGEQMNRNAFGRRCFRFEEEWQTGTLSALDADNGQLRNEAKGHVIRTHRTVAELRDLERAQQHGPASKKNELFDIAMEAVKNHFQPAEGQTRYTSVLLLDTQWDPQSKVIRGHAALGGGDGTIQLAIFGSHALQSYPSCIEEVVPAFTDCTKTDTKYVANDLDESGSNWEAVNIGIGAHMHEVGHLFGCPHQESGVMLRDYVTLNRTFICRESFATRTNSPGQRLCLPSDECAWHRLDCLRFRYHPCFGLPTDGLLNTDKSVQVWAVDNASMLITAPTGVAWVELYAEGESECKSHIEYIDGNVSGTMPRQIILHEDDLRNRLPREQQKKKIRMLAFSAGGGAYEVQDVGQLVSKSNHLKLPNGQVGFRGSKLGFSSMAGSEPQEIILQNITDQRKLLKQIRVYSGMALDGIEFIFEDTSTQLFGKRSGKDGGYEFHLDTRRGETLAGFYIRAGLWIDGLQVLTSHGRKSEIFGNGSGGTGYTLIPPRGYNMAGISGSVAQWVDGFALIISR